MLLLISYNIKGTCIYIYFNAPMKLVNYKIQMVQHTLGTLSNIMVRIQ